jgi:hypothetical protein
LRRRGGAAILRFATELAAIEQGHGAAPPAGLDAISAALGLDPRLLRRVCADAPT